MKIIKNTYFSNKSNLYIIFAFILCLLIYSLGVNGPYIRDDITNILHNKQLILNEVTWENIKAAATSNPVTEYKRPISMLTFSANYTLAGNMDVFSAKATNIVIHIFNGIGLYFLLINLLSFSKIEINKARTIASISAAFWLIQPLNVSTVLYVVQRMAMLSSFFIIYGCLSYVIIRRLSLNNHFASFFIFPTVILFTALAFFSKENGALLPGFLLLIELFFINFLSHKKQSKIISYALFLLILIPTLYVIYYLCHFYIIHYNNDIERYFFTLKERVLTQFRVLWHYVFWSLQVNPEPMSIIHDDIRVSKNILSPASTLISIVSWIAIFCACIYKVKSKSIYIFSFFWFLWGHTIESSVLPLALVFEHRNYLPSIGICLAFSYFIIDFSDKIQIHTLYKQITIILVLLILPAWSLYDRVKNWRNYNDFYISLIRKQPNSAQANIEVAAFLSNTGNKDLALQSIQKAQKINPLEPGYVFAEASMICHHTPNTIFSNELNNKLTSSLTSDKITSYFILQYRNFSENCGKSGVNKSTVFSIHNVLSHNKNWKLAATSYYGKGLIFLYERKFTKTIEEWEKSLKVAHWLELQPEIDRLKILLNSTSH
jgi:protein O-mannosyl-transferase